MSALIPVSVITGFLGSGKTTLLRRLLTDPRMGETAVVINEFGEVGLDHLLVRKVDENIVMLNSGCLCCALRDDLVETLDELHGKRTAGTVPNFERVVIETSGLADPAPIIHTLMTDAALTQHHRLQALMTTADAEHGSAQLDTYPEAVKQAAMADRMVITKTDLVASSIRDALKSRLAALNPSAAVFDAGLEFGPGPDKLFDAGGFFAADKSEEVRNWLREEAYNALVRSTGQAEGVGEGDPNRHDDRIDAFCIIAETPLDWERFLAWLNLLLTNRGDQLLRVKGILNVAGRPYPLVIHGVQHVFYPPTELPGWPTDDRRSRIVFITRDLPKAAVERSFERVHAPARAASLT